MLFNSIEYLLFFPLVVTLYFLVSHRFRWLLLLVASYVFYAWWRVSYLALIVVSTLVNYLAAIQIARSPTPRRRRTILLLCLFTDLGILFTFKYWNFFNDVAGHLFMAM